MNKMKKIFSILLMVVFLVNTFLGSTSKNAFADGTLKTQLRIINLNGDGTIDENTEFWVNKDIPAAADLTVSGTGVNIQNPKLKITVQKTNSTTRPEFVDSQKAVKNERTEDNDNYYMTYSFDRLNGGAKLTFPMPFKFLESANKGDTVTIKEELFDENGGLIDSATKTYVANKVGYTFNDSSVYADTPDQLQQLIDPSKPAKNNTLFVRKVDDYTDSDKTKEDGEGTQVNSYYNFTVKDTATVDPNATYMSPENIKIELKLPEGVDVMDGRFSFDPATRTATRIVNKPSLDRVWKGSYNEIVYWFGTGLLFKGKKYNEVINIEAKFTVNAGLADEKKLPDRTLPIKLEKNKLTFGAQRWTEVLKYKLNAQGNDPVPNRVNNGVYTLYNNKLFDDWNNDQTDNGLMYITRIGNENNGSSPTNPGGGIRLHLWEIEDVLMRDKPVQDEKKIYYKYFQLGKVEKFRDRGGDDTRRQQLVDDAINQVNSTPNKLYGIKEDGSKVELASNIKLGQRVDINDTTGQYTRLSLVFERPISLDNTALFYYTGAYPSEKEIKKFEDGEYDKEQYYYGSEHIVAEEAENATTKENAKKSEGNSIWAWTGLRLPTPKAYIGNFNGTGVLPYKADGTYADIHLDHASLRGRYGAWGPYLGKPVTNPKIIYLLPAEFSFVKTKAIATNGIDKSKIGEPEVIKNFRNTGRTAVIYSLPDITPTLEDKNDTIWMDLQIEASPYAKQGNNQVDVFYTYDNNDIIQPWNDDQTYVDELDLDGDGNKKEKFTHRKHDINFIPPLELLMYKNVGLTTDNMRYAEVGDVGEPFYWKVSINNNTISEVTDISFIDTLPFVGDHVITPNKKGEYKERGSKFMTPLANSLESVKANEEVLKNFDVYYQLKPQNILETVRDGEWLSKDQVTDFSQVKSIKVMLKPGAKLASKTTVDFYIPSKIPFDTTLTETQTANNSVAISTDKYSYSEANTATIGVARYTIKGTVFSDFNKDGLMTDNEEKLSGYKVELIDKKTGDVAVDVNGQKLETTTDNEGKYTINAYKRGDYFVRFTKLSDEDV
ncbi:SdrD B-like domain-containing protein, partial [Gemella morbillorum]